MVDTAFQALSAADKRDALRVVQGLSGRRAHLLEKDIWVVQTLSVLFDAPFGAGLYKTAVSGGLQLVPTGFAHEALAGDYRAMLDDGMLPDDSEPFEALIERCADVEARANELETDDG